MAGTPTFNGFNGLAQVLLEHLPELQLHLASATFTESYFTLPGNVQEAFFEGYAPQTIQLDTPSWVFPPGRMVIDCGTYSWTCTGATGGNLIFGYWLEDLDENIWLTELFTGSPRPMQQGGQVVAFDFQFQFFSPFGTPELV